MSRGVNIVRERERDGKEPALAGRLMWEARPWCAREHLERGPATEET